MHRDIPVAKLKMEDKIPIGYDEVFDKSELPMGTFHDNPTTAQILFIKWYESRSIPSTRPYIKELEEKLGKTRAELFIESAGVSITDGYWIKEDSNDIKWSDINYHDNGFDELMLQSKMKQFITGFHSPDITTDGVMEKFWYQVHGLPFLAKLDTIKDGILMANEVLYSNIAASVGIKTTPYTHGTIGELNFCTCPSFITNADDDFILAMQVKHQDMRLSGERLLQHFMHSLGFSKEIRQMMTLDCIFHNTDRHEKNFGYILHKDNSISFVPLYDNGYCLGANHNTFGLITDADMKLLPDTRTKILDRYGYPLELEKAYALSELEKTYALFHIPEERYKKAKHELATGLNIYEEYRTRQNTQILIPSQKEDDCMELD